MQKQGQSIFNKYSVNLSDTNDNQSIPLKHHAQIPYIIDILSRNKNHHVIVHGISSDKIQTALTEGLALHLKTGHIPKKLQDAEIIFFHATHYHLTDENPNQMLHDLQALSSEIASTHKHCVFIMNDDVLLQKQQTPLGQFLQSKLFDSQWRIIILTQHYSAPVFALESVFTKLRFNEPKDSETLAILKSFRDEIETFHNITMPDEVFSYALSLTKHYLGGQSHLDKALDLLDSSAARASTLDRNDQSGQSYKPVLTTTILAHVAASWTHIPLSHLHHNKFKLSKFLQSIQQRIIGQDAAINTIGSLLQTTCIKIQENVSSICNLLLTGPDGIGKKEFAFALADYLFASHEALFTVTLNQHLSPSSLADISVTVHSDKIQHLNLLEAIESKPYAILLFENLDKADAATISLFNDIFMHGYGMDQNGKIYDFSHAIVIITTTLGAEHITKLTQRQSDASSPQIMDLMQLVLNDNSNQLGIQQSLSQNEIQEHLVPVLGTVFSADILRFSHIIPFIPLDQHCLEKIIKFKMNALVKSLEKEFDIELSYAPEVVKFIAYETIKLNNNAQPLGKLLEQYVYAIIANEILARIDDKNKPKRLALLLNDSGQMLTITPLGEMQRGLHELSS